jgi:SNF2 family DNA or RNA helicase
VIYLDARKGRDRQDPSRAEHSDFIVPTPAGKAFLPYQLAGIEYMLQRGDVLLADVMGIGKTIEAIGVSNAMPHVRSVLIVCPATLKDNWKKEWEAWDTKGLSVGIAKKTLPDTDIAIINYDVLKKFRTPIRNRRWDILIADEIHYAKNKKAIRTREVLGGIKRNSEGKIVDRVSAITALKRLYLSGTPMRKPKDLWPLLQVVDPDGLGSNWHAFAKRYCGLFEIERWNPTIGKKEHVGWKWDGAENLAELQTVMRQRFMLRRLKKDVLKDLPPKRRQIILIEGNKKLDKLLKDERIEYDKYKKFEGDINVEFGEMSRLREEIGLATVPFALKYIEEALENEDKVVIFARHHSVIDKIAAALGNAMVVLDGRTPIGKRQEIIDRFQNDPTVRGFIGSIKAAGVGTTLTAASLAIFVEEEWTPDDLTQAEDRLHRKTQTRGVNIQHLLIKNSLDEKMISHIIEEQERIDAALDKKGG